MPDEPQQTAEGPWRPGAGSAWPPGDAAIREALLSAWRDGDWGRYHGKRCDRLRSALAERHRVAHAHLCASGTLAVELALRAVGVGPGDGVLLAGYDFPGNFRAIEAVGATPVLVDIDPGAWSMDVASLAAHADAAEMKGVRAVIVSHLHGGLADMARLAGLAAERGWRVVEDACQAVGAQLGGRPVGAWGDIGVLSFGGSKLLTAGRGGALLTDDDELFQRLRVATGRGNDIAPLSELQAAVLLPQLDSLPQRHNLRERAAARLRLATAAVGETLRAVQEHGDASHAYYKFAWLVGEPGDATEQIGAALRAEGAPVDRGFRGFTKRSRRRCRRVGGLPHSEAAAQRTLLLHHPPLLDGDESIDGLAAVVSRTASASRLG